MTTTKKTESSPQPGIINIGGRTVSHCVGTKNHKGNHKQAYINAGLIFDKCSARGCDEKAVHCAHVQLNGGYIHMTIPVCIGHHKPTETFTTKAGVKGLKVPFLTQMYYTALYHYWISGLLGLMSVRGLYYFYSKNEEPENYLNETDFFSQ